MSRKKKIQPISSSDSAVGEGISSTVGGGESNVQLPDEQNISSIADTNMDASQTLSSLELQEDDESKDDESKDDESKDDESKDDESKDDESKDDESKDDESKDDTSEPILTVGLMKLLYTGNTPISLDAAMVGVFRKVVIYPNQLVLLPEMLGRHWVKKPFFTKVEL